jgi:hypothetical protein
MKCDSVSFRVQDHRHIADILFYERLRNEHLSTGPFHPSQFHSYVSGMSREIHQHPLSGRLIKILIKNQRSRRALTRVHPGKPGHLQGADLLTVQLKIKDIFIKPDGALHIHDRYLKPAHDIILLLHFADTPLHGVDSSWSF